jgi:MATE family multidrug resistance protein
MSIYFSGANRVASMLTVTSSSLTYQLPYALSVAAAVRVGNLIGAQHVPIARIASIVSVGLGGCVGLFNSLLLVLNKGHWGELFTKEKEVVEMVANIVRPFSSTSTISFRKTDGTNAS